MAASALLGIVPMPPSPTGQKNLGKESDSDSDDDSHGRLTRSQTPSGREVQQECLICLEKFQETSSSAEVPEVLVKTLCHHKFHFICIRTWLRTTGYTRPTECPYCRQKVFASELEVFVSSNYPTNFPGGNTDAVPAVPPPNPAPMPTRILPPRAARSNNAYGTPR